MVKTDPPRNSIEFIEKLKRQWMATVDAIVDPLMIVDSGYRIIKANRAVAEHAGIPITQVVGAKCYKVFAGLDKPCPGCQMAKALETNRAHSFELSHVFGQKVHEVVSQPIHDSDDEVTGVLQIYRDRTEAKMLWEQLLQSEKLASIGLLAGGVAHEINNPLGGILIFSQMLLREMDKQSQHYQDVVEIEAAAQRCKFIVENLLQFARKPGLTPKEFGDHFDLRGTLDDALRLAMVGQRQKHFQVKKTYPTSPVNLAGCRNKIMQVMLNILQNAIHAMGSGGKLHLSIKTRRGEANKHLVVAITDNGVGIAPEVIHKIFDPFFTTKDPTEGTGLGLAICHGIVKEIGGDIEVSSTPGKGATFRIVLPASIIIKPKRGK